MEWSEDDFFEESRKRGGREGERWGNRKKGHLVRRERYLWAEENES